MMNSRPTKRPETRGPFKKLRKSISGILSSNAFLLIVSFLAALLTWGALVAADGTLMREKTMTNVPVSVSGETSLRTRGYIVMDDIKTLAEVVGLLAAFTLHASHRKAGHHRKRNYCFHAPDYTIRKQTTSSTPCRRR